MSPFLSFFPNFYLLLALPLVNLFFNHLSPLWKNGDNFMSRCIIIQMHLCTFWTGQECISMHSQNKAHLLDNPQRTVSTAAWRGHALVFQKNFAAPCCVSRHWAHLPQMLRLRITMHFIETTGTLSLLRHKKSSTSIMLVEIQVTGSKKITQALSLLYPSLYNTSTEQLNTNYKYTVSIIATLHSVLKRAKDWWHVLPYFRRVQHLARMC